jgi:NADPH2:quinone reductase
MRAIQVRSTAGPEVLELCTLPDPVPEAGEVLVPVHTSGVNFIDVYYREGKYHAPLPFTPGGEGSGYVEALGEGVTDFSVGDPVAWWGPLGSYAEKAIVAAKTIVKVPLEVNLQSAAALMVQGATAYYLSHLTFELKPGNTALVHAAAGGVGYLLTQMAKGAGATVIATASNPKKAELAREAGADEIILYTQTKFDEEVKRITNGIGLDVVYDGVGQATFEMPSATRSPRALRGRQRPCIARLAAMGSLYVTRPISLGYVRKRKELTSITDAIFTMYKTGQLKLLVNPPYALKDVGKGSPRSGRSGNDRKACALD